MEEKQKACELLKGSKRTEFISDVTEQVYNLISNVCDISDKYNVDRDSSMEYVAGIINTISATASIKEFEKQLVEKGD